MNILKLWLVNNSTIDLEISDEDLATEQTRLGAVMVDQFALYTIPLQDVETVVPGRNILFYQVCPIVDEEEESENLQS